LKSEYVDFVTHGRSKTTNIYEYRVQVISIILDTRITIGTM